MKEGPKKAKETEESKGKDGSGGSGVVTAAHAGRGVSGCSPMFFAMSMVPPFG